MEPKEQRRTAVAFKTDGDLKRVLSLIGGNPSPKTDAQAAFLSTLIDTWDRANPDTKARFMAHASLALVGSVAA